MANMCRNYLQVVTKHTLENPIGLGICMARFASHCGIIGAHPKHGGGGATPQVWMPTTPQLTVGRRPLGGRGGGGGLGGGVLGGGAGEGGSLGGGGGVGHLRTVGYAARV